MDTLQRTLLYCARACWGLAVVYLALPFALGIRTGVPAFAGFLLGALVIAVVGLLLYGSSRFGTRQPEVPLATYLLRWVAAGGWVAFSVLTLLAVWLTVQQPWAK